MEDNAFPVYKGLQKPLMFKGFKGKFIYIGFGVVLTALTVSIILASVLSFIWGGLALVGILFGGLYLTATKQKKGLHNKTKSSGIYILTNTFSLQKQ